MTSETAQHIIQVDTYVDILQAYHPFEFRQLWNGVGSQHWLLKNFNLPKKWRQRFSEPSKFHDIGCWVGGNSWHAQVVHWEFWMRCMREAGLNLIGQYHAIKAYLAVSAASKICFDYRDEPRTLEELITVAKRKKQRLMRR